MPSVRPDSRRVQSMIGIWTLAVIVGIGLVVYGFGPMLQAREQRELIRAQTLAVDQASNETSGLAGPVVPTKAPEPGAPVAILEIGRLKLQQVVVEGVGSSQTRKGPGHVQGTAGLGQPGNSVVVGRAHGFGGPFRGLARLKVNDRILVTTTQGQSVYAVSSVRKASLRSKPPADPTAQGTSVDDLYGASKDDRLTLVTSRSPVPWNHVRAVVVVATLEGKPFQPASQNGRNDALTGLSGETGASAAVLVAMAVFGIALAASVLLYQRFRFATAYMLAIGPILASAIIAGETLSRIFPAWT